MTLKIHAKDAFYLKKDTVPISVRQKLKYEGTLYFFSERACNDCEFKEDRLKSETKLTPTCEECAAFLGGANLCNEVIVGKNKYVRYPIGDGSSLKRVLKEKNIDYTVKRHHPNSPMKRSIEFLGKYRGEYQSEAVAAIVKKKRGVLRSPPRSGKTVMVASAVCEVGQKTMILASQREWLMGFHETFVGSQTQKALTNCRKTSIGFCKKYEDFLKYDICLVTVQTFYNERGQRLLKEIANLFGFLAIDEVHTSAAPEYAKVLSVLNVEWCVGCSGTPERKDGRDSIMRKLIGPDLYSAEVERLRPKVCLTRTQYVKNTRGNQLWVRMVSSLEKDPKRLKLIAKTALKDVEQGHMVLIPFAQITPIKALVKAINIMAGRTVAQPFHGGLKKKDREQFLQDARSYKIKILVGNIKLLSTGTNIPRASALYEVAMSSNAPNAEQRYSRILTPYKNKPQPIIRFFLDDSSVRRKCMANEYWQVLHRKFNPIISPVDLKVLKAYFADQDKKDNSPIFM